uniref:Uncharacterized protein n=1 Tax=viral metagenome TaxID=1070528 RepID=A0A6C0HLY9_9ZZZZ
MIIKKSTKKNSSNEILHILETKHKHKNTQYTKKKHLHNKTPIFLKKKKKDDKKITEYNQKGSGLSSVLGFWFSGIIMNSDVRADTYGKMSKSIIIKLFLLNKIKQVSDAEYKTYCAHYKGCYYFHKMRSIGIQMHTQYFKLFKGDKSIIQIIHRLIDNIFIKQNEIENAFNSSDGKEISKNVENVKKIIKEQDKLRVKLMKYTAFTNTKDLTGCIVSKIKKIATLGISSNYKTAICSLIKYRNIEAEFNKYYNKFITQFRIYLAYFPYCTDEIKKLDILSLDLTEKKREKPFDSSKCNIDANNQKINMLLEKTLDLHANLLPEKYKEKKFDIPNQKRTKFINDSKNFGELHKKFTTYLEAMNNFFAQAETIGIHRFWSLLPRDKKFLEYFSNTKSEEYKNAELIAISKDPQFKKHFATLMQNINRDASIILEPKDLKIGSIIPIIYIDCITQILGAPNNMQTEFKVLSVNICGNDKIPGNKISVYCADDTHISVTEEELPHIICIQQGTSDMIKKNGEFATNFLEDKYFAACFSVYQQNKYMIVFVKKSIVYNKLLNLNTYELINQTPYFILSDLPKELPKLTNEKAFNVVNIVFVTGEIIPPVAGAPLPTLDPKYQYQITNIVNLELVGNGAYDLFNVKSINAYSKSFEPANPSMLTTGLRSVQIKSIKKICEKYILPNTTLIYCGDFGGIFEDYVTLPNAQLTQRIIDLLLEPKYTHFKYTNIDLRNFYTNGLDDSCFENYIFEVNLRITNFVTDNIIYSDLINNPLSGNPRYEIIPIKQSITHSCNKFVIHMPIFIRLNLSNYQGYANTLGIEYMRERIKGKIGDTGKPNNPTNFISLYTPDELRNIIKIMDKILSFFPYGKKPYIKRELGCLTDDDTEYGIRKYIQEADIHNKFFGRGKTPDATKITQQLEDIQKFYTLGFPAFIETYLYQLANTYYTGENTKNKAIYYSENQISMLDVITKPDTKNNLLPILKNFSLNKIDVPLRLLLIPTEDLKQIANIDYINPVQTIENPNDNPTDYDELSKKFILNFYRDTARPQLENYLNTMMNEIRNITGNNINFIGFLQELDGNGSLINLQKYKNIQYLCRFIFISLRLKFMDVQIQNYEKYLDKKEQPLVDKQLMAMKRQTYIELYDKTFKLLQSNIINSSIIDIVSGDVNGYPIYEDTDDNFNRKLQEFKTSTALTFTLTTAKITVNKIYNEFNTINEKDYILNDPKLDKSGVGTIDDMRYLEVYLYAKLNLATKHITKLLNDMHDSKDYNDYFSSLMKYTDIETIFNNIDKTITYKKEVQNDTDTFIYNTIKLNLLPAYKQVQEYYCEYFKSFIKIYYKYFYSAYKQVVKKNAGAFITNTDKQTALDKINKYITKIANFYKSIDHVDCKLTNNIKQIIESIKNIKKYIENDESLEIKVLPYITSYNSKYIEDVKSINNNQVIYTGYDNGYDIGSNDNGSNDNGADDNISNNAMITGGSLHSKKLKKSKSKHLKDVDADDVAGADDDPDDFADDDGDDYKICTNAAIEYFIYIGTLAKADITDTTLLNKIQVLAKYLIMCIKKIGTKNHSCLNILKVINTMNCNLYVILIKKTHAAILINFKYYFDEINTLFKDIYKRAETEYKYLTYLLGNALMFYIATTTYYINYYKIAGTAAGTTDIIFNDIAKPLIISLNDLMFMNNFIKYGTSNDVLKNIIKQKKSEYCGLYKNLLKLEKYNIDAQDEINNVQSTNMLTELKTKSIEIMHNLYQLNKTSTNLVELEKNFNSIETHTGTIGINSNDPLINYNIIEQATINNIQQLSGLTINIVLNKNVLETLPAQFKKTAVPFKHFAVTEVNVNQNNKYIFTENARNPNPSIWTSYNNLKNTYCNTVNIYIKNVYENVYRIQYPNQDIIDFNQEFNTFIDLNFYDYDLKFNHIQTITSCKNFLDTFVPNNKVILTINKIWNDMQNDAIIERLANFPINNVHNIPLPPHQPHMPNNYANNLFSYIINHLYVNVHKLYICIHDIQLDIVAVQAIIIANVPPPGIPLGIPNEINDIHNTLAHFLNTLRIYITDHTTYYQKLCSIVYNLLTNVDTNIIPISFSNANIQIAAHNNNNQNYDTFFKIITMLYRYFTQLQKFILEQNTLLISKLIIYNARANNQYPPDLFNPINYNNIYNSVVINKIQNWYMPLPNQQYQFQNILQNSSLCYNNYENYLNIEKCVNKVIFITFDDNAKNQILYNTVYALLMLYLQCKDINEEIEIKNVAKYLCIQSYTTYIPIYKFDNKIYNAKYYGTILNTTQFDTDIPKIIMLNTYTEYSKYAKKHLETIIDLLYVSMANFISFKMFNYIFTSLIENRNDTDECINFIDDLEYTEPTGTILTDLKTKYTNLNKYFYCCNALNYMISINNLDYDRIKSYIDSMDLINYINELIQNCALMQHIQPINTAVTNDILVPDVNRALNIIGGIAMRDIERDITDNEISSLIGKAKKYNPINGQPVLDSHRYRNLLRENIKDICFYILTNYINIISFETCLEIIKKCINTFKYNIKTLFYLYEQKKLTQNDINNLNKANTISLYSISNDRRIVNNSFSIFTFINKIINNSSDSIFYNQRPINFNNVIQNFPTMYNTITCKDIDNIPNAHYNWLVYSFEIMNKMHCELIKYQTDTNLIIPLLFNTINSDNTKFKSIGKLIATSNTLFTVVSYTNISEAKLSADKIQTFNTDIQTIKGEIALTNFYDNAIIANIIANTDKVFEAIRKFYNIKNLESLISKIIELVQNVVENKAKKSVKELINKDCSTFYKDLKNKYIEFYDYIKNTVTYIYNILNNVHLLPGAPDTIDQNDLSKLYTHFVNIHNFQKFAVYYLVQLYKLWTNLLILNNVKDINYNKITELYEQVKPHILEHIPDFDLQAELNNELIKLILIFEKDKNILEMPTTADIQNIKVDRGRGIALYYMNTIHNTHHHYNITTNRILTSVDNLYLYFCYYKYNTRGITYNDSFPVQTAPAIPPTTPPTTLNIDPNLLIYNIDLINNPEQVLDIGTAFNAYKTAMLQFVFDGTNSLMGGGKMFTHKQQIYNRKKTKRLTKQSSKQSPTQLLKHSPKLNIATYEQYKINKKTKKHSKY